MFLDHRVMQIGFGNGFVAGAIFSILVCMLIFVVIDFNLESDAIISIIGSLSISIFSLTAAWIALRGNRAQILIAQDLEIERRASDLKSAKAILPATLSEVCRIARNNIRARFIGANHAEIYQPLSQALITQISETLRYADPQSSELLANIIRHIQVMDARRGEFDDARLTPDGELTASSLRAISDAIGWATIYALSESAFPYARGACATVSRINTDRVRSAFLFAGIHLENYEHLSRALERRIAAGSIETDWGERV